jgi:PAS domain S-box-containing protein
MSTSSAVTIVQRALLGDAWMNAALAVLIADEHGRYIAANERACEMTGYSRDEIAGFRIGRELAADVRSAAIYADLERGRMRGKKVVKCKDGTLIPCRYWGIRTRVSDLPYFLLLLWPERERGTRTTGAIAAGA